MPKSSANSKSASTQEAALLSLILDSIQDIKGKNIIQIDLSKIPEAPAKYFIICEGESSTQIRAIANNTAKRVKEETNISANHIEGQLGAKWVLVDFFDIIVHVFDKSTRQFYDLENLWNDGKTIEYQNI
ncbi:MAG: ribosome silencing factor [Saprospiraceae bacterium]